MLGRLLKRIRKDADPAAKAEKDRLRREGKQAARRADFENAKQRNYGGLP